MSREALLWKTVRDRLRKYGHLQRIENMVGSGLCDVNLCIRGRESWVELKRLDAWPRDPATIVRCDHYTPQQRNWMRARGQAGGRVYLFAQIDSDFLMFGWSVAVSIFGLAPRSALEAGALFVRDRFPEEELVRELTSLTPYKSIT